MYVHTAFYCLLISAFVPAFASAHPVSFKDGYGVMPGYTKERQELELNYSITSSSAIALNSIKLEYDEEDLVFILPQFNHKFYRKNEAESQTNLYGSFGLGTARYRDQTEVAGVASFQADYETRRIYTLISAEHLQTEAIGLNRVRYRIGVAPYLADFESFHTWLIGQVEFTPELDDEWTVTPMVRFFYKNFLVEIGSSLKGDPFVAGIFHF
jgi:hypothetical protein